ncbi:MAG: hypothetical protein AAGA68_24705 [Pseudomonadota bacterium]
METGLWVATVSAVPARAAPALVGRLVNEVLLALRVCPGAASAALHRLPMAMPLAARRALLTLPLPD